MKEILGLDELSEEVLMHHLLAMLFISLLFATSCLSAEKPAKPIRIAGYLPRQNTVSAPRIFPALSGMLTLGSSCIFSNQGGRKMKRLLCWALVLCVSMMVFPVFAHGDWAAPASAKRMKNPVKPTEASIQKGKEIYGQKCAACHGATGEGNGPAGSALKPKPANLKESLKEKITDGDFFWRISTGRGPMPSFEKQLTKTEIWEVINYIRTFKK